MRVRFLTNRVTAMLGAVSVPVLAIAVLLFVTVSADVNPPNTGMADPAALVNAFDRSVGNDPANLLVLSLSSLRGVSGEALNAGGRVRIDLAAGSVTSTVRLLPTDDTFDLWLIDNRQAPVTRRSPSPWMS